MGTMTYIEWCDHTWNPWRGCEHDSPGCDHCYAELLSLRNPAVLGEWGPDGLRVVAAEDYWRLPIRWDREAAAAGVRRRVFALSLGDWLEARPELHAPRLRMLDTIRRTPNLDYLLVTKRPQNWRSLVGLSIAQVPGSCAGYDETIAWVADWLCGKAPANVWAIASVEDRERAERRVPDLLEIPAVVRGLSMEPLLGHVDLGQLRCGHRFDREGATYYDALKGYSWWGGTGDFGIHGPAISWVIVGGESGPHARPMHPYWARSIRDQCVSAGVPFFFKQWGEWNPLGKTGGLDPDHWYPGRDPKVNHEFPTGQHTYRVGKKAAGRLLDGREWSEFPQR